MRSSFRDIDLDTNLALQEVIDLSAAVGDPPLDELKRDLQFAQLNRFVKYIYSGGDLTQKQIYEDNTETVQLFQVDYTYSGGDLTQITVERISDSATYTDTFSYSGGDLVSIETA